MIMNNDDKLVDIVSLYTTISKNRTPFVEWKGVYVSSSYSVFFLGILLVHLVLSFNTI